MINIKSSTGVAKIQSQAAIPATIQAIRGFETMLRSLREDLENGDYVDKDTASLRNVIVEARRMVNDKAHSMWLEE
jgi:hypothetical protein